MQLYTATAHMSDVFIDHIKNNDIKIDREEGMYDEE